MTSFPWELVVLAVVLAVNRLLTPYVVNRPVIFWSIQVFDILAGLTVGIVGLPGLERFAVVNWMIAALLAFHVVQNLALRDRAKLKKERDAAEEELREAMRHHRPDEPQT